ncbi:MAG: HEPN domain-containing protein [Schwartzia sp. (in: firmicutes)]
MSDERTLYDIAKANYTSAVHLYRHKTDDEILLNIVGYHLQQTVELALKHCLEMEGKAYPKTHDISDLLAHFSDAADWEALELLAPKITELEARTRYDKDFSANVKIIERVFAVTRQFLDWVSEQETRRMSEAEQESAVLNTAAMKENR